jgi:excinuclease ABC subunit B
MYADTVTRSMQRAIDETNRRRARQLAWNEEHGITPRTILKSRAEIMQATLAAGDRGRESSPPAATERPWEAVLAGAGEPRAIVEQLEAEMERAAGALEFETAAEIRDRLEDLKAQWGLGTGEGDAS